MVNLIYNQLHENVLERQKVDKPLLNWFLLVFVLSWLTVGIALIYVFIKRILRVDKYIRRKYEFFDIVIHFIELESNERGLDDYETHMADLKIRLATFQRKVKPIMPFVIKAFIPIVIFTIFIVLFIIFTGFSNISSFILTAILIIWGIDVTIVFGIYIYKMNKVWDDIQQFEYGIYGTISHVFMSFKLIEKPIIYYTNPKMKKNFILYSLLGFITCGVWFLVWDYHIHKAPDNMYHTFHGAEDTMVEVAALCCKRD